MEALVTRFLRALLPAILLTAAIGAPAAALEVKLTVSDASGTARKAGTVTSGVPFARGAVKDVKKLSVSVDGKAVPAQFEALARWDDGSVRWALLDCQADVAAGGKTELIIRDDGKNPAPAAAVKVVPAPEKLVISTGPMKLVVDRKKFTLLSSVTVDGKQLITSASRGLVLYTADGKEVLASPPQLVKVERAGPLRATVLLRGTFAGVHGGKLGYSLRLHAYAGAKFVKLRVWLENRGAHGYAGRKQKPTPEWFAFDGLSVELGLGLGAEISAECEGASAKGSLKVLQRGGKLAAMKYAVKSGGKQLKSGARTDGVMTLSGDGGKLTAAMRHFWQNCEKAVELDGKALKLWIWPREGQWPRPLGRISSYAKGLARSACRKGLYNLPGSVHKSSEMILDFSGRASAETSAELSAPLFAVAPAAYYAGTEAAPGLFAPPGVKTGEDECDAKLAAWTRMTRSLADPKSPSGIPAARKNGAGFWYGWMDFGDLSLPGRGPVSLHNDWPWVMLTGTMRSGDLRLLRMADEMMRHRVEVDQQWSDSDAATAGIRGFQRGSGGFAEFHCNQFSRSHPDITGTWLPGVVLYYMLTGDAKTRECIERSGSALARFWKTAPKSKNWYVRRKMGDMQVCARSIFAGCALYGLTADKKWLEFAQNIFRTRVVGKWKWDGSHLHDRRQIRRQGYTKDDVRYCYSIQALCLLHHLTGDKHLFELLKVGADRDFPDNFFDAPLFLADLHAYVALKTGKEDYGEDAAELWIEGSPEGKCPPVFLKDNTRWSTRRAMHMRAGHILQYYFWKRGKVKPTDPIVPLKIPPTVEFAAGAKKLVVEGESFLLERVQLKKLAGASGGQAVLFNYLDGRATRNVKLKKGTYEVMAYIFAPHREADAFFMKLANKYERICADKKGEVSTCTKMIVKMKADGVTQLRIEPAEIDFMIDRVEITKTD
jgi:PcRGLX-like N-terminal RIFT barrel domain